MRLWIVGRTRKEGCDDESSHSSIVAFVLLIVAVAAGLGVAQLGTTQHAAAQNSYETIDALYNCIDSGAYAETWGDWAEAIAYCADVPVSVVWDFLQFVLCPGVFQDGYWDDGPTC